MRTLVVTQVCLSTVCDCVCDVTGGGQYILGFIGRPGTFQHTHFLYFDVHYVCLRSVNVSTVLITAARSTVTRLLSPFKHRISPNLGPIRKSNIFSVFAVYVMHKFNTYLGTFCS